MRQGRSDDADAFIREHGKKGYETQDDLAAVLASDFLASATSGEDVAGEDFEQEVPEEIGGPFLVTDGGREFDLESDGSNPPDATKEPLPTVMGHGPPTQEDWDRAEEEEQLARRAGSAQSGSPSTHKQVG